VAGHLFRCCNFEVEPADLSDFFSLARPAPSSRCSATNVALWRLLSDSADTTSVYGGTALALSASASPSRPGPQVPLWACAGFLALRALIEADVSYTALTSFAARRPRLEPRTRVPRMPIMIEVQVASSLRFKGE
jgi:hypothetical protein